jgi:hypothetical protein
VSRRRRPPASQVVTRAEFEHHYERMVAVTVRAIERDPEIAREWRDGDAAERCDLVARLMDERGRRGIAPLAEPGATSLPVRCFVCTAPTAEDDHVFVVGARRLVGCATCVATARAKAGRN